MKITTNYTKEKNLGAFLCRWSVLTAFALLFLSVLAVSSHAATKATYEVWGGNTLHIEPDTTPYYNVDKLGYVKLGTSYCTDTFYGTYKYYVIAAKPQKVDCFLDAVQGSDGRYYNGDMAGGNVLSDSWRNVFGPPDNKYMVLLSFANRTFAVFYNLGNWSSITVYTGSDENGQVDIPYSTAKVKAASILCKAIFACYTSKVKNDTFDGYSCITNAGNTFNDAWDKLDVKYQNCDADVSGNDMFDAINQEIFSLCDDIADGIVDHNDKNARNYAKSLLSAASKKCDSYLKAENANIKKSDANKLKIAKEKADKAFADSCSKADKNRINKNVSYSGPDMTAIGYEIEDLVKNIMQGIE